MANAFGSFGVLSIGDVLIDVGHKLDFVAGASFWYSMEGSVVDDLPFVFQDYYRSILQLRTVQNTPVTRAQMFYDPIFKVFWIMWVLRYSFGIAMTKTGADVEVAKKKARETRKKAAAAKAMAKATRAEAKVAEEDAASATGEAAAVALAEAGRKVAAATEAEREKGAADREVAALQEERPVEFMPYNGTEDMALSWTLGQLIYFTGNGQCDPPLVG